MNAILFIKLEDMMSCSLITTALDKIMNAMVQERQEEADENDVLNMCSHWDAKFVTSHATVK